MPIVIQKTSGGIAVMRILPGGDEQTCIEQWKAANPGEYASHVEVDESAIPSDRARRNSWRLVGGAVVVGPLDRAALAARIDAAVAAVYDRPMTYSKEYEAREAQAKAYKDAGYTGAAPPRVAGFAAPAGMTAQAATDLILSQAAQLRGALDQLSDLRMRKYLVARAATDAEAAVIGEQVLADIAAIAAAIR